MNEIKVRERSKFIGKMEMEMKKRDKMNGVTVELGDE